MHVLVNGVRLFFDVEGSHLVPDGPAMRRSRRSFFSTASRDRPLDLRPSLVPRRYRPGRVRGPARERPQRSRRKRAGPWPSGATTCVPSASARIGRPIVLGMSFGGTVALAYATRHPAHPAKLILGNTEAAGGRIGSVA